MLVLGNYCITNETIFAEKQFYLEEALVDNQL